MTYRLGLLIALAMITACPATAMDSYSKGSTPVRSAPGVDSRDVSTLYNGQRVDLKHCEAGWCFVRAGDVEGWVNEPNLAFHGHAP